MSITQTLSSLTDPVTTQPVTTHRLHHHHGPHTITITIQACHHTDLSPLIDSVTTDRNCQHIQTPSLYTGSVTIHPTATHRPVTVVFYNSWPQAPAFPPSSPSLSDSCGYHVIYSLARCKGDSYTAMFPVSCLFPALPCDCHGLVWPCRDPAHLMSQLCYCHCLLPTRLQHVCTKWSAWRSVGPSREPASVHRWARERTAGGRWPYTQLKRTRNLSSYGPQVCQDCFSGFSPERHRM